ncbi:MAG: hypothetical protein QOJ54_2448 [Aliidongia sp.]|nr:hypothetical protein [Aliidongia sp.]
MIGFLTRSIPRRILASLVAIYLVTYIATAIVVYSSVRASIIESDTLALHQLAEAKYDRLVTAFEGLATDVAAWAQLEVMNDLVSGDIDKRVTRTLEGVKQLYGLTGEIYAFDAAGNLIASTLSRRDDAQIAALPPAWQVGKSHLTMLDKHQDPITGAAILALEKPIFASFDRDYRVGTLVLTYPWDGVEKLLFSRGTGTVLLKIGDPPEILSADPNVREPQDSWKTEADDTLIVGRSAPRAGILAQWQVMARQDTSAVTRSLRRVGLELLLLGALLSIPIVALGRWLSNRLTAPIMELTRVVGEIADTDKLDARVPVSSSDELGTLARSFNRMTENLQRATQEREQFVCDLEALNESLEVKVGARTQELEAAVAAQHRLIIDISHEIKSPLARLGVALGLARRSSLDAASKQFDRMEREIGNVSALASELLTLARLDSAAAIVEFTAFDLAVLVREIVADAVYEAPTREFDLRVETPNRAAFVMGNADLLRRAIENVVRNALFYTAARTPIDIILSVHHDRLAAIEVRDEGPGVPESALLHLFEPFYRVDEARARKTGGSGIGLAICQRVASLHGGTVHARANAPQGLIVEIEIPLDQRQR